MEGSMKEQKLRAMKSYRRAKFVYNFVLYSLTSLITCFFFSYPFWSPSVARFFASLQTTIIPCFLSAKCLFFVGNFIVVILIGESRLRQPSSSQLDVYDEYLARSRRPNPNMNLDGSKVEEKGVEKRKGLRSCRSEVWGGSERKREKSRGKREDEMKMCKDGKVGMRSCKSEVWGEKKEVSYKVQKKEEKGAKNEEKKAWRGEIMVQNEESYNKVQKKEDKGTKNGMRSCKSEVWCENEAAAKQEEGHKVQKKEENGTKNGMRSCRSAVWGERDRNPKGMRSCKSAVWGDESEIVERSEEEKGCITPEDLNKRVEAFIARVNKQRLLEAT